VNGVVLARALHVLGVVIWVGGVAMVAMVILPAQHNVEVPERRVQRFEAIEGRFTWIARAATLVVGGSGFYLLHAMAAWGLFARPSHWWLHAMVAVWAVWAVWAVFTPTGGSSFDHEDDQPGNALARLYRRNQPRRAAQRAMPSMFALSTVDAAASAPRVRAFHFKNPTSSLFGAEPRA